MVRKEEFIVKVGNELDTADRERILRGVPDCRGAGENVEVKFALAFSRFLHSIRYARSGRNDFGPFQ